MANFIAGFVKRGGLAVLFSTASVKLSSAILSIIVVRLLSKEEYGTLSYVLSIFSIATVIAGFGGNFSLLRFGSIANSASEKLVYYNYTIKAGTKYVALVAVAVCIFACLNLTMEGALFFLVMASIALFPSYLLESLRSYFRILNLNKLYSLLNVQNSILFVIFTIVFTFFWGLYGYMVTLILVPTLLFYYYQRRINKIKIWRFIEYSFPRKEYWRYGIHTSVSAIANQVIFSIAPFFLGVLGETEANIATFKVATVIPFALLFLPSILMITDFNFIAKNYRKKSELIAYYKGYLKLVIPISLVVFSLLIVFADEVVKFIFGAQYESSIKMYQLFMVATFFTFLFRNPLGNILLAVGKANWNGLNAYLSCALYILFSFALYSYWGVWSFVYCLCGIFILSGFLSLYYFRHYLHLLDIANESCTL